MCHVNYNAAVSLETKLKEYKSVYNDDISSLNNIRSFCEGMKIKFDTLSSFASQCIINGRAIDGGAFASYAKTMEEQCSMIDEYVGKLIGYISSCDDKITNYVPKLKHSNCGYCGECQRMNEEHAFLVNDTSYRSVV